MRLQIQSPYGDVYRRYAFDDTPNTPAPTAFAVELQERLPDEVKAVMAGPPTPSPEGVTVTISGSLEAIPLVEQAARKIWYAVPQR